MRRLYHRLRRAVNRSNHERNKISFFVVLPGSGALALVKDHNESIWATEKQLGVMDETDFERFMATTKFRSFIDGYTAEKPGAA